MTKEQFWMWYFILGILTCLFNGAVRKMEADALLGFSWFLLWPMTPIGNAIVFTIHAYRAIKAYQPYRRTKIYFLRNF